MTTVGRLCLVGAVALPLLGAGAMALLRARRLTGARLSAGLHWFGVALTGLLVVLVAVHGTIDVGIHSGRSVIIGLSANRLTVTLIALVLGIGAVVQSFSVRYLRTDPRSSRFVIGAGVLVASMTVVAASTTLVGLLVGWVLASIGFLVIVGYRPDLPGVRPSTRRTAVAFLIGDGALVVATVIVSLRVGNIALVGHASLSHVADRLGGAGTIVALLVVVAALARCAQGPFGRWLPGTVAAPTPVSALLHAGFVNGGGILLIRTGAISSSSTVAMVVAFAVAAATAVVATAIMAQRSDVKSELAYSTMGQMGFMVAECAVGALGAGVVHLIGHGLYKATLFLGSGAQMPRPGGVAPVADSARTFGRVVMAGVAGLASLGVVLAAPGISGHRASGPLVLFVALTAGVGAWSLWTKHHAGRAVLSACLIVVASALYGLVAAGLYAWVGPSLPQVGSAALSPWLLLAVAAGGAAAALLLHAPVVGLRLRMALIDIGAPAPRSTQRFEAQRPIPIPQSRPLDRDLARVERGMTDTATPTRHARLLVELDEAARVIGPLWPLGTFIAVNPFWDLRQLGFEAAVSVARMVFGANGLPSPDYFVDALASGRVTSADVVGAAAELAEGAVSSARSSDDLAGWSSTLPDSAVDVNRQLAKWCAAFLSAELPGAPDAAFYASWHAVVRFDPGARALLGRQGRALLADLPDRAEDAIAWCLSELGLDRDGWRREFVTQLAALPGWAAHAKWRSRWATPGTPGPALDLVDFVAVRLAYDTIWRRGQSVPPASSAPRGSTRHGVVHDPRSVPGLSHAAQTSLAALDRDRASSAWLLALEHHYRDELLGLLGPTGVQATPDPDAQVVCCIDARSEGIRRHLESVGNYETFGFAGFFALPLRYTALGAEPVDLLPVLLSPTVDMAEQAVVGQEDAGLRRLAGEQVRAQGGHAFDQTRQNGVAPFMLAEAGGFVAAPLLAARTLRPARFTRVRERLSALIAPAVPTQVDADPDRTGMPDEEQALFAETALTTMGLTQGFAPLVVLCGHGSTTENNPHAASLDCGACGGNRGADSARAACAILNRGPVRALLAERGIVIPDTTYFVAAEHDTATDTVSFLDLHLVPAQHLESVARLRDDLTRAGAALAAERLADLDPTSDGDPVEAVHYRSADWAELQPEWGLARNASFIVGPRTMTAGVDLRRRSFLHSYDPEVDLDGTALETILTAPMVVAHWINMQYYFSTVDPDVFAAGDKTVHNVVAGIGVTEGAGGDLKVGLPLQSLFVEERAFHEPMRLLTVVEAPITRIDEVIARNPVLRDLFGGQWVHLAARNSRTDQWMLRRIDGIWIPWDPPTTAAPRNDSSTNEQEVHHG